MIFKSDLQGNENENDRLIDRNNYDFKNGNMRYDQRIQQLHKLNILITKSII